MKTQTINYTNGTTNFIGYLTWDDTRSGPRPGVVVFPEAFGLNDHARERADRLAQLGYVALAADLHGEGAVHKDMTTLGPAMKKLSGDRQNWRSVATSALTALSALPQVDKQRLGAIGFCFGGTTCLELARSGAPLAAVVTFHSGLNAEAPEDAGKIRARVLICHGAEDPLVSKDAIDTLMSEFRRDKVDWQFIHYGNAMHSFSNPAADMSKMPGLAYDRKTESRSWMTMQHWFEEAFA
jgi:dienelactone hydrolase